MDDAKKLEDRRPVDLAHDRLCYRLQQTQTKQYRRHHLLRNVHPIKAYGSLRTQAVGKNPLPTRSLLVVNSVGIETTYKNTSASSQDLTAGLLATQSLMIKKGGGFFLIPDATSSTNF